MTRESVNTIWIVDDNPTDRFVHRKLLEMHHIGKSVEEFSSGKKALEALLALPGKDKEETPDIILLDVMMPEMNGFDFMVHFGNQKARLPKIPLVYMLSSTDDDNDIRRVKTNPDIQKMLRKPFSPESLLNALSKL